MTKSERQILLWLCGITSESYYEHGKMHNGICTQSERMGNAARNLHKMGFPINMESGGNDRGEFTYWINKPELTESVRSDAITRSVLYEVRG